MIIYWVDGKPNVAIGNSFQEITLATAHELHEKGEITKEETVETHD